jgi:hypothetical protein
MKATQTGPVALLRGDATQRIDARAEDRTAILDPAWVRPSPAAFALDARVRPALDLRGKHSCSGRPDKGRWISYSISVVSQRQSVGNA